MCYNYSFWKKNADMCVALSNQFFLFIREPNGTKSQLQDMTHE
jgi:hypothetical protein